MRKYFALIILICFIQPLFPAMPSAQEKEDKTKENQSISTEKREIIHRSGLKSFFYSLCLGPRIGLEYNEGRKVRTSEALCWIPIFGWVLHFINAVDAGKGKTMSEVVSKEGLDE